MGTFLTIPLGLVNSGSGLLGRGVAVTFGSDARESVGRCEGCEGVEVNVERIDAAEGLDTGCLEEAIIGGVTREANVELVSVTETCCWGKKHHFNTRFNLSHSNQ